MTDLINPIRSDNESIPKIVASLKQTLGVQLAKLILGVDGRTLNLWIKGDAVPTTEQKRLIYSAGYTVEILRSALSAKDTKLWLVSPSEYLFGIPAIELHARPDDVQYAALNRITRGEYYDLLNAKLAGGE